MKTINDNELENVTGGAVKIKYMKVACTKCKEVFDADMSKNREKCPNCGRVNTFEG